MGATENAGFNAKYNGILGLILYKKTAQITAKTSTSLQLSVTDMLTHVNFPTFTTVDTRYGGLIRTIHYYYYTRLTAFFPGQPG